jgi:predicted MFS family arabinose efflux permease
MAAIAISLALFGSAAVPTAVLLALWGLIGTALPVAWWTWLSRTFPENAEPAGGLMVAVIQLAITIGAAGGGWLYDIAGYRGAFLFGAFCLVLCSAVFFVCVRPRTHSGKTK